MKKLLASSALVLVGFASAASAQSVLERVLSKIDNSTNLASVNGTFANIAENIGGATAVNSYTADAAPSAGAPAGTTAATWSAGTLTQATYDQLLARNTAAAVYDSVTGDQVYYDANTGAVIRSAEYSQLTASQRAAYTAVADATTLIKNGDGTFSTISTTNRNAELSYRQSLVSSLTSITPTVSLTGPAAGIDGSIINIVDGITEATQTATAGVVNAVEYNMPTLNWGAMSTTVLGAVNTGEITLGVNQSVEQAKTTSTGALSSLVDQIGGSADTGAIVLNVASNMTGVNGSIRNTMTEVNGSVGALGTTVLGAVNTGTITSGVNAAVSGIVGGGTSQTGGIPAN